jgi:pimeloyl-ACP methyl ester carboxylesterase
MPEAATVERDVVPEGGSVGPRERLPRPRWEEVTIHRHRVSYRVAGEGPVVVLVHGVTGTSEQWDAVAPMLAERFTVVAPDLLGHGRSAKPRGDYSLGAYAVSIRDLMIALGHRRATVVGHSLGGGIAMQFAYQFPMFCERLGLVSSGGLGPEVHLLLRAATLPGSELVLPLIAHDRVRSVGGFVGRLLGRLGLSARADLAEMARGYASLGDASAREAFLHTLRAVIDPWGQRVSATDRLYLAADTPTLIVWGKRDPLIPVAHAGIAHRGMPGSRMEVFDRAGHFPMLDEPARFARTLTGFIEETEPSRFDLTDEDLDYFRELLRAGPDGAAAADGGEPSALRSAAGPESRRRAS